jgi:protein-disulfide isomerase
MKTNTSRIIVVLQVCVFICLFIIIYQQYLQIDFLKDVFKNQNRPKNTINFSPSNSIGERKGSDDAKVTLSLFFDYECGYCTDFFKQTFLELEKDYISTGKINYYQYNLPLESHPKGYMAAKSAECAKQQSKYWEMHSKIISQNNLSVSELKKSAFEIQLDTAIFCKCLKNSNTDSIVKKQKDFANSYQIKGTPTFIINNRLIQGNPGYLLLKGIINEEIINNDKCN